MDCGWPGEVVVEEAWRIDNLKGLICLEGDVWAVVDGRDGWRLGCRSQGRIAVLKADREGREMEVIRDDVVRGLSRIGFAAIEVAIVNVWPYRAV